MASVVSDEERRQAARCEHAAAKCEPLRAVGLRAMACWLRSGARRGFLNSAPVALEDAFIVANAAVACAEGKPERAWRRDEVATWRGVCGGEDLAAALMDETMHLAREADLWPWPEAEREVDSERQAADLYAQRRREVETLLSRLKYEVAQHAEWARTEGLDFGHVGDLAHLRKRLTEAVAFLARVEPEGVTV